MAQEDKLHLIKPIVYHPNGQWKLECIKGYKCYDCKKAASD